MKTGTKNTLSLASVLAVVSLALVAVKNDPGHKQATTILEPGTAPINDLAVASPKTEALVTPPVSGAPFIVKDTDNDSPGTNNVTRIVTITAEIGGAAPIALQWKVDKGHGFEDIPGATNDTFRIGNAEVGHTGRYSLFATNSLGGISTTPVPLIVIEEED